MIIEKANVEEHKILTNITKKSKAYWEYSPEQILMWSNNLTISKEYIKKNDVFKYGKQDLKSIIHGKLGRDTTGNLREPIDMNWVAKNGAIVAYSNKDVFIMKINENS